MSELEENIEKLRLKAKNKTCYDEFIYDMLPENNVKYLNDVQILYKTKC